MSESDNKLTAFCKTCLKPIDQCTCDTTLKPFRQCPNCGEALTINHNCQLCSRCGKYHSANVLCLAPPITKRCPKCGKPAVHVCTPCPNCGNVHLGLCMQPLIICKSCGKPVLLNEPKKICTCIKCGKTVTHGAQHICELQLQCPRCGGLFGRCKCFVVNPPIIRDDLLVQKVIAEADIGKHFSEGWAFKVQLQSGSVIVEKAVDAERIVDAVLEQARKQIEDTVAKADVEVVTEKVLEQANKQIEEAITLEKQRLLKA